MATFDEKNGGIYTLKFLNTSLAKNYWSTKTSDPSDSNIFFKSCPEAIHELYDIKVEYCNVPGHLFLV